MRKSKRIMTVRFGYCADRVPRLDGLIHETYEIRRDGTIIHTREFRDKNDSTTQEYNVNHRKARRFLRRLDSQYKLHKWSSGYTKSSLGQSLREQFAGATSGAGRYWSLEVTRGPQQDCEMMAGTSEPPFSKKIRKEALSLYRPAQRPKIFET